MKRRRFLNAGLATTLHGALLRGQSGGLPNIVLILADDLGYGDLGCYGSPIPTPNLDAMASEGVRFEQYYTTSSVCSPSRASLLTGRYSTRVGVPRVLFPSDQCGLSLSETTVAQVLKAQGYRTACVGKWHLGSQPDYLPTRRGFDHFFGVPYSHDMSPPLMWDTEVIDPSPRADSLTGMFTEQAVNHIGNSGSSPFFLYLAHTAPHIPLGVSEPFLGRSGFGPYGDCVQELDWGVGQVMNALRANNLDQNTLVLFTSDNGPWYLGSPGRLRGRKGETFEGGMRVPLLARWPSVIPANRTTGAMASALDILPTLARLGSAPLPEAPLDGVDILPLLTCEREDVRRPPLLYFDGCDLQCARMGPWKLHVARQSSPAWGPEPSCGRFNLPLLEPELYNVDADPGEDYELSRDHPDQVEDLRSKMEDAVQTFPAEVQNAWYQTMARKVAPTPVGALPVAQPA